MIIEYRGESLWHSGYSEACRNNIALIDKLIKQDEYKDIKFTIYHTGHVESDCIAHDWKTRIVKGCQNRYTNPDIVISHCMATELPKYYVEGKYNICVTAWETNLLPKKWAEDLNKHADEIWVLSHHNKTVFENSGVTKPINILHPTLWEQDYELPLPSEQAKMVMDQIPKNKFVFYGIFEWIRRKGPEELIEAYTSEFTNKDDVTLLLKTYYAHPSVPKDHITKHLGIIQHELGIPLDECPTITLLLDRVDNATIKHIHKRGNCFVLPHRGEGWGIPIQDAIMYGNPVITTRLGGVEEFLPENYSYNLPYRMRPVRNYYWIWNPFNAKMKWADIDVLALAESMRRVYDKWKTKDFSSITKEVVATKHYMEKKFSPQKNLIRLSKLVDYSIKQAEKLKANSRKMSKVIKS